MVRRSWKPSTPVMESAIKTIFCRKIYGPNFNAVMTKLQENDIGSPGEKYIVQHYGFDRDFWAGSPDSPMTVIYQVHVKPPSATFDPSHCVGVSLIQMAHKLCHARLFLKDSHERRTAEIEHVFVRDKDAWSASIEGVKWTGVSMFRLASLVEPKVMRTAKGRETGTGYTKPDAPLHWPQEVTTCPQPKQSSWQWDRSKSQQHWGWEAMESDQESRSWHSDKPESKETWTVRKVREDTVAAARKVTETITEQVNAVHATSQWNQRCDPLCCQKCGQSS